MKYARLPVALTVVLFLGILTGGGCATKTDPTKEQGIQLLRDFLAALEAKDYDKAASLMYFAPGDPPTPKGLAQLQGEMSMAGIEVLAAKGTWGKLEDVGGRVRNAGKHRKLPSDECYGIKSEGGKYQGGSAAFFWDGQRLKLLDCDDISTLSPL